MEKETDEAERWQARRVIWRRRFEVTGPTLKQDVLTSARLSHQRCMPAWQTLRMFLWDKVHTGWLVEAAFFVFVRLGNSGYLAEEERGFQEDFELYKKTTRKSLPTWFLLRTVPPVTDFSFHRKRQVLLFRSAEEIKYYGHFLTMGSKYDQIQIYVNDTLGTYKIIFKSYSCHVFYKNMFS